MSVPRRGPPGLITEFPYTITDPPLPGQIVSEILEHYGEGGSPADKTDVFRDAHRPSLKDGSYTVTVDHAVEVAGSGRDLGDGNAQRSWTFDIEGPRYALPKDLIRSVYPPDGDEGDHVDVLPHIVLTRSTLPWERGAVAGMKDSPPWLTVVAVGPDDAVRVADHPEHEDGPGVRYLSLDVTRLPEETKDLTRGAHVRLSAVGTPEASTVLGMRPMTSGKWTLHLVSVEGLYNGETGKLEASARAEVVSLYSWRVTVIDKGRAHFDELAAGLDVGAFGVSLPDSGLTVSDRELIAGGAVPLAHRLRDGETTVSWYRGPFLGSRKIRPDVKFDAPARSGNDLLVVDSDRGMIDTTYAAAWEYGRLMTIARRRVATSLARWKRQRRRGQHAAACCADHAAAGFVRMEHGATTPFPEKDYFRLDLGLLAAVPFGCMVPDPAALPPESLRFFDVDPCWIHCLQDGAFVTGRATEGDFMADCATCETRCHCKVGACACQGPPAPEQGLGGLLLRSRLVSDLPDLKLEAAALDGRNLTLRRLSSPSPGVLMALYDGRPAGVRLSLPPEKMHFEARQGKTDANNAAQFAKDHLVEQHVKTRTYSARNKTDPDAAHGTKS